MDNIIPSHHLIFTPENPMHPTKHGQNPSIEEVTHFLNSNGENAQIMEGHYGTPERSIMVSHPKNVKGLFQMAKDFGQDSLIHSQNGQHEMHYLNGPNAGTSVKGEGTNFFKEKPSDNFSTINSPNGPIHFQHNFNFEPTKKFESVQGTEEQSEEPLFKPYRSDAQRRWAHSPTGKKALGGDAAVHEWDEATKGKKLPEKVKKEELKKAPLPYTGFEQLAPEDNPNLKNPEEKKTTKKIKEVNLPNGLIYRQYTDQSPHKMQADEMDQRSGRRVHALFHPDHPTPLAILETAHEHNALAPKGMYPHKVDVAEVDKDFRGKGLGRQLYLATLVHGTKQLTSDSRTSNDANNAWKSFRGLPGLGGKIGRSPKPGELNFRPGLADSYEEDRHQLHIKDPNALDHNKMFPKVDIFDKLAASEKKVNLAEIKHLLEAPQEIETMDIPEHLQMQWSTPYHRWGR